MSITKLRFNIEGWALYKFSRIPFLDISIFQPSILYHRLMKLGVMLYEKSDIDF